MATDQGEREFSVRVHFQDVRNSDTLRRECEAAVEQLQTEFPETSTYEVTLTHTGDLHETHVHVIGKELEVAAKALGQTAGESLTEALDRTRRQLRKHHDKVRLAPRRKVPHKRS